MKEQAMTETQKAIEAEAEDYALKNGWHSEEAKNSLGKEWCKRDFIAGRSASDEAKDGRIGELEEALRELVELKRLKDSQGKTEDYLQRQPAAWLNAFHILHKNKNQ